MSIYIVRNALGVRPAKVKIVRAATAAYTPPLQITASACLRKEPARETHGQ